jgi:hypothetical protein
LSPPPILDAIFGLVTNGARNRSPLVAKLFMRLNKLAFLFNSPRATPLIAVCGFVQPTVAALLSGSAVINGGSDACPLSLAVVLDSGHQVGVFTT